MKTIEEIHHFCRENIKSYEEYKPYPFRWKSYILNFEKNGDDISLNSCVGYIKKITENTNIKFNMDLDLYQIHQNGDIELVVHLQ